MKLAMKEEMGEAPHGLLGSERAVGDAIDIDDGAGTRQPSTRASSGREEVALGQSRAREVAG